MTLDTKILLVDDHPIVRAGLRALLSQEPGFHVVGESASGEEALRHIHELHPDVVVMDLRMPLLNGIEATRQALALNPGIKVVGLSADGDDRLAVQLLLAGALAFVRKEAAYEELIAAIRAALKNNIYCKASLLAQLAALRETRSCSSAFDLLSPSERRHLQLIAEGHSTKQIAANLQVSVKTAETHRRNLLAKLNVSSVAELTKYALREGLTNP